MSHPYETALAHVAAARRLGWPVEWHGGFALTAGELRAHPDYRGQETVNLGLSLARDDRLDPGIIGDASRTARHDPQALKYVWHCLARFGSPEMARFLLLSQWVCALIVITKGKHPTGEPVAPPPQVVLVKPKFWIATAPARVTTARETPRTRTAEKAVATPATTATATPARALTGKVMPKLTAMWLTVNPAAPGASYVRATPA